MDKTHATLADPGHAPILSDTAADSSAALDALDDEAAGLVFVATYPRREARADALKAWRQTRANRPALSVLIDALAAHAVAMDWTRERRQFIPLPATWLRGRRWEDDVDGVVLSPLLASRLERMRSAAQGKAVARMSGLESASLAAGDQAMQKLLQQRAQQAGPLQMVKGRAATEPAAMVDAVGERLRRRA